MAIWRPMNLDDIEGLTRVADVVHSELPESDVVFAERVRLFPEGCLVLEEDEKVCGYAISHPIRYGQPPALDSLLGELALDADQLYIHDVCVLPDFRGHGYAAEAVDKLLAVAESYTTTCLVSVYGTAPFWARFGFRQPDEIDPTLLEKIRGYGDDAVYLERHNPN
ncbi:acyl-CoA N-acyltransferase [Xylaria sp. FL0933]|nr:acyl-CoA N-acyltransferase [Xylaria sp. FL0933]